MKTISYTVLLITLILTQTMGVAMGASNPQARQIESKLKQINYSFEKLEPLYENQQWDDKGFQRSYKQYVKKANSYIERFAKKFPDYAGLEELKARYQKFYLPYADYEQEAEKNKESDRQAHQEKMQQASRAREEQAKGTQRQTQEVRSERKQNPMMQMLNAQYAQKPDNGIGNEFHRSKLNEIVFGEYDYGGSTGRLNTSFKFPSKLNYYLFLEKSIHNLAMDQRDSNSAWGALSENGVHLRFTLNNKHVKSWQEFSSSDRKWDEKATFLVGEFSTKASSNMYRYIEELLYYNVVPGVNEVKIEAFLTNSSLYGGYRGRGDALAETGVKLSEGSFELVAAKDDIIAYREDNPRRVQRTLTNNCNRSVIVEEVRGRHSSKLTVKPNQTFQTIGFTEGTKIYLINPVSGSRRFHMTVGEDDIDISFGCP